MCEPISASTLAWIAIGTAAAGATVTAVAAIQQGKAAQKQAKFNAQVNENNAVLAERQAADALRRGRLAERQKRLASSQLEGSQRANLSANNVVLGTGSAADVLEFTAGQNELEALNIRTASEREAVGFKTRAQQSRSAGALSLAEGESARTASIFTAGSSILGGASQAARTGAVFRSGGVI
jgi:hypothetical protein